MLLWHIRQLGLKHIILAALLTSVADNTNKVAEYIAASKKMGIELLPPDINEGFSGFSVSNNKIRFGLSAIKNVGKGNIAALVESREKDGLYLSMTEFLDRIGPQLNTRCIESFIKAGAFDSLGGRRSQYMSIYKIIYSGLGQSKKRNIDGQLSLFQIAEDSTNIFKDELPDIAEYSKNELLAMEKEVLGIYVSGHPLMEYADVLNRFISATSLAFAAQDEESEISSGNIKVTDGQRAVVGGIISYITTKYTKNGKPMAFVGIEDLFGNIEIIMFSDSFSRYSYLLKEGGVILAEGRVTATEGQESKIICEKVVPYDELVERSSVLWLKIPKESNLTPENIRNIIVLSKGKTPVIIYNEETKEKLKLKENYWVNPNENLISDLKTLLGEKSVVLKKN